MLEGTKGASEQDGDDRDHCRGTERGTVHEGGRKASLCFALLRMTLQPTIEGERWTHNGRRSRTIIDRRVYEAGHQLTD